MTKRSFLTATPRNRAVRMRHMRRRLYLQDGVLSVRFIKFINEQPAPEPVNVDSAICESCDKPFISGFKKDGIGICDACIRALCPQPEPFDPEKHAVISHSGVNNQGIIWASAERIEKQPETAEEWAAGLSLGGITPPWDGPEGGAA